jgi:hypothetical protein
LTAVELAKSHEAAKRLDAEFGYLPGVRNAAGQIVAAHKGAKALSVILALESDLAEDGLGEVDRYRKIYGDERPSVRAICVAGRGYWWALDEGKWFGLKGGDKFDEILSFIGGISNTYKGISLSRGYPQLGNYITPNVTATEY